MNVGTVARVKMGNCGGFRNVKSKARTRVCVGLATYELCGRWLAVLAYPSQVQGPPAASLQYSIRPLPVCALLTAVGLSAIRSQPSLKLNARL